jgi:hypothetical protein
VVAPFRGKQAVMNELMRPLFAQFADRYRRLVMSG